jgi:hypothetical protein
MHDMKPSIAKLFITAAFCLSLGPVAAADLDLAGDIKAQAAKLVKVENPEVLPTIKRVVITSFMVDFVSELKYSKSLNGLEAMIGADSDVSIKLVGSSNEQFQSIADRFYDQTVELLKARGIEVVSQDDLSVLPEFAELAASGVTPLPSEQDAKAGKGLFFSAHGLPLHLIDETQFISRISFGKKQEDDFLTFGARFSGGFAAAQAQQIESRIARKLDATILKVRLTVLGGQLTPDAGFWTSGKVTTRAAASFVNFVTRYAFIDVEGNKARVSLQETVSTDEIGELVNTTSGGTKTVDTAKNVALVALNVASFAARIGGMRTGYTGGFASTSDYECRVQAEPFEKTLLSHHDVIVRMFGERMQNPGQ